MMSRRPQVRHGAVLGLAELLTALRRCGVALTPLARASVAAAVPDIVAARLLLGKGGELMRGAACRRARCIVASGSGVLVVHNHENQV